MEEQHYFFLTQNKSNVINAKTTGKLVCLMLPRVSEKFSLRGEDNNQNLVSVALYYDEELTEFSFSQVTEIVWT